MGIKRLIGAAAFVSLTGAGVATLGATSQAQEAPITIQVLGTNDFHGRIRSAAPDAGAAIMAGAVNELRAANPNTVFAAAGDLIGASTFESFIQQDKPTIDALNAAGLEVSAVGNHEFDQGYDDLTERVMAPYDPVTNPFGGAEWEYLGANVRFDDAARSPALPETWIQDFGDVEVGFVGAVTDHLPELVSPDGIAGLVIEPPVVAANRSAADLKAAGADIVVLLVHEGAATTALSSATDPTSDFGEIVNGASPDIDAIISGHTHLAYNHLIEVPAWVAEGRTVTTRPVVSAGQYGANLNQILFHVDPATLELASVSSAILPLLTTPPYPSDPAVAAIVAEAVADAEVLGAQPLGEIAGPFNRAKRLSSTTGAVEENRGGESTLGNLVAEVQQTATSDPAFGGAQIAFMNPGGLRADMVGTPPYPSVLTYRQAANVQPFANTLVNMRLTGAQIKTVLEQQWQPAGAARPFLRLGISEGFTYTYDPAGAPGARITGMWLDGVAIEPATTYSVTVNSFLAAGGDNFFELANGADKRDTGQIDLQAMVDYMAENSPEDGSGVPVDHTQRSIGVSFPAGAPAAYQPGAEVTFTVSSLLMAAVPAGGPGTSDSEIAVALDGVPVGTFPVDNSIPSGTTDDEAGKATVTFTLPAGIGAGEHTLTITGTTTGSTAIVPLTTAAAASTTTLTASAPSQVYGSRQTVTLTATVSVGDEPATGSVDFVIGDDVVRTAQLVNGAAAYTLPADTPAGDVTVTARYAGTPDVVAPSEASATVTVEKATSTTVLLSTRTHQRRGALLPTLLISATGLNNGEMPRGYVEFRDGDTVVSRAGTLVGLSLYLVPRSLSVGTHTFTATFVPFDSANYAGSTSNPITITVRR